MSIFKRATQLFHIGVATRRVQQSRSENERVLAKHALGRLLADARGISMKVGQLLAGVDPDNPLQPLLNNIPALPLEQILPLLSSALGAPVHSSFKNIQPAAHAASLGQVHFAELLDGTPVAIKIRYPDIANLVAAELALAGLMPEVGPVQQWGFDLRAYKLALHSNMQRELDYRSEAQRQESFRQQVQVEGLCVPKIYAAWSREQVLVQSRANGVMLTDVRHWSFAERKRVTEILLQTFFCSLFSAGEIHADPHPGNYLFERCASGKITVHLLDFGCTLSISSTQRLALLKLIIACRKHQAVSPLDCLVALGFAADKLQFILASLPALCQILLRPFNSDGVFIPAEWHLEPDIKQLLGEDRWWFRAAGPAELLWLMRAFQGLLLQLEVLKTPVDWWANLLDTINPTLVERAQQLELPVIQAQAPDFAGLARRLQVLVTENGEPRVNVTLPSAAVLQLEQIIPPDVIEKLEQSQTASLPEIMQRLRTQGLQPQILFEFGDHAKRYKVWLE